MAFDERLAERVRDALDARPGRPMRGWVLVGGDVIAGDAELGFRVDEGAADAASMPPKGRV